MSTFSLISLVIILLPVFILILLHIGFIPPRIVGTKTPADFSMDYKELQIITEKNKKIFGWFIPTTQSAPLIVIMHGWGSNSELMLPIAQTFYQTGMNVVLLDSRCHGKSAGDTYSALPRFSEDIHHTIEHIKKNLSFNGKLILLGHSVGAGAVLYTASKRNDIAAVISISAFGSPHWLMTRYFKSFRLPKLMIKFLLNYIQWIIGHYFSEIAPVNTIKKITIPALIVHGTHDTTVPIEDAYAINKNNANGKLLIIDDAEHDSVEKIETHGQLLIDFLKQEQLV
ncbi:MAG: alpha/beta fold hydrolase [Gammaproteobacteria bacterium]|nr:alpha/beta fold hydrolase [Gammaproteobacteria bacterium]